MSDTPDYLSNSLEVSDSGTKIVSFCCDVTLYTSQDLSRIGSQVLQIYDEYLALVGKENLNWYSTETMRQHKKITRNTYELLPKLFSEKSRSRAVINLNLKSGKHFADAPSYSFWVWGSEKADSSHGFVSNVIRCSFPWTFLSESPDEYLRFVTDLYDTFPFQSGHAGYVLQTTPYEKLKSESKAWQLSMRHPGLDISNPITDSVALANECIKGVNWITALSNQFIERLGGERSLSEQSTGSIEYISVANGLLIKAGEFPSIGDVNRGDDLPAYREVYQLIQPLQEKLIDRYGAFELPGPDYREKTQAWLTRFGRDNI